MMWSAAAQIKVGAFDRVRMVGFRGVMQASVGSNVHMMGILWGVNSGLSWAYDMWSRGLVARGWVGGGGYL